VESFGIFGSAQAREKDLVRVVYVSEAAAEMSAEARTALAERSRERSARARLTGLLLRHGRHYYAVIEGPRRRVLQCVEEIIVEQGQRGLRILREEAIPERRFVNWRYGDVPVGSREQAPSDFLWRFCGVRAE
jgi:hypothetical protein